MNCSKKYKSYRLQDNNIFSIIVLKNKNINILKNSFINPLSYFEDINIKNMRNRSKITNQNGYNILSANFVTKNLDDAVSFIYGKKTTFEEIFISASIIEIEYDEEKAIIELTNYYDNLFLKN